MSKMRTNSDVPMPSDYCCCASASLFGSIVVVVNRLNYCEMRRVFVLLFTGLSRLPVPRNSPLWKWCCFQNMAWIWGVNLSLEDNFWLETFDGRTVTLFPLGQSGGSRFLGHVVRLDQTLNGWSRTRNMPSEWFPRRDLWCQLPGAGYQNGQDLLADIRLAVWRCKAVRWTKVLTQGVHPRWWLMPGVWSAGTATIGRLPRIERLLFGPTICTKRYVRRLMPETAPKYFLLLICWSTGIHRRGVTLQFADWRATVVQAFGDGRCIKRVCMHYSAVAQEPWWSNWCGRILPEIDRTRSSVVYRKSDPIVYGNRRSLAIYNWIYWTILLMIRLSLVSIAVSTVVWWTYSLSICFTKSWIADYI